VPGNGFVARLLRYGYEPCAGYGSFNQPWDKRQIGRADLLVGQMAAQQRRPTTRCVIVASCRQVKLRHDF